MPFMNRSRSLKEKVLPKTRPVEERIAYLDGTDLQHELGATDVTLYASPEDAEEVMGGEHVAECGIAEVKIVFVRWVKEGKL